MPCLICNDPVTVKSHLTPKAFVHSVRGSETHAYEGSLAFRGIRSRQAGVFDKTILCDSHERMLCDCDTYAVNWVKQLSSDLLAAGSGALLDIPNSRPDLLLKFVCSHVWRRAVSPQNSGYDMDLGPWEGKLRDLIFGSGSDYNPTFHVFRQRWTSEGEELKELLIPPHRIPGQGKRRWEFDLGGLLWVLRLNERDIDRRFEALKANDTDPVRVLVLDDRELTQRPGALDILVNMRTARDHQE